MKAVRWRVEMPGDLSGDLSSGLSGDLSSDLSGDLSGDLTVSFVCNEVKIWSGIVIGLV